jgi:hypothetical protein
VITYFCTQAYLGGLHGVDAQAGAQGAHVIHAPVRKSFHRVCFLLPHVKPIYFLTTMEKQLVVMLFLHPVHFVLGAGGLVPGVLHADQ